MILFNAPRRLGLRPTSVHSNVDFINVAVNEIKVDFIEKKVGKMNFFLNMALLRMALPYMST